MSIKYLEPVWPKIQSPQPSMADHPMRAVTRQIVEEPNGWTPERKRKVSDLFDSLADQWSSRKSPERELTLTDALQRGLETTGGTALEVGVGSGLMTPMLRSHFDTVISIDLSQAMLDHIPPPRSGMVRGDASQLPFASGVFDVVVVVNMFLFAQEYLRVSKNGATLLWVSSVGEQTPIYLHPLEVESALGVEVSGVWSDAGVGRWGSFRRG